VHRDRIFVAFYHRFQQLCIAGSRSQPIVCRNCMVLDLIDDKWYWRKTMVMEMMMDERI